MSDQPPEMQRILRVCRHEGCFYFEKGWRVGGEDRLVGNLLEQVTLCPVLKQRETGLVDDCPYWPDATVESVAG